MNSNNNNNNNINSNRNNEFEINFYKVFHNQYIRYQIIKNLKLFNIHSKIKFPIEPTTINYRYGYYLTNIIFNKGQDDSHQSILQDLLPCNTSSIKFSFYFNREISVDTTFQALNNLTSITFGCDYNKPILDNTFPKTLKSLKFGRLFNQELESGGGLSKMNNLESIVFGQKFNNRNKPLAIGSFPSDANLERIKFGNEFNCDLVPGVLPSTLKILKLGVSYKRPIKQIGSLPTSLQKLKVCTVSGCHLPSEVLSSLVNLKSLSLRHTSILHIDLLALPPSLRSLEFGPPDVQFYCPIYENHLIPTNIRIIKGDLLDVNLPPPVNLQQLVFSGFFNKSLLDLDKLKDKYSKFFQQSPIEFEPFKYDLNLLFHKLQTIKFSSFNKEIEINTLPSHLTTLIMGDKFNSEFQENSLPPTLTHLDLGQEYNKKFKDNVLPLNSLTTLILGPRFQHEVPPNLIKLKTLTIPDTYSFDFQDSNLKELEKLHFKTTLAKSAHTSFSHDTINFFNRFISPISSSIKYIQLSNNHTFSVPLNHHSIEPILNNCSNLHSLNIGDNPSKTIFDQNEPIIQFKELIVFGTNQSFLKNLNNINQYLNILKVI